MYVLLRGVIMKTTVSFTPTAAYVLIVGMAVTITSPVCHAQWKPTKILQMDGDAVGEEIPAEQQIVTESWNRIVAVPYIVYMPEKDRVLMLVNCDYLSSHQPMTIISDDQGATWSGPRPVSKDPEVNGAAGLSKCLTYLGNGKLAFSANERWFSSDYGETWEGPVPIPLATNGQRWGQWDPYLVDRDPTSGVVTRVMEAGCNEEDGGWDSPAGYDQGHVRFSMDEGRTWGPNIKVPEWYAVSEVALVRAKDRSIVAGCRTAMMREHLGNIDHYDGLGVSISKDDGATWSHVNRLYCCGRMHPCMVVMPSGDIVMTYVVRRGYPRDENDFPQFGIEAIVSHDNGASWDIPHRYVLAKWSGNRKGRKEWYASCQGTSTVLLPDGSLLTAFGTGYRSQTNAEGRNPAPRDVGLVRWEVGVTSDE
jgi:hypothetical protein